MMQVSPKLRRTTTGYSHWCPGCQQMHQIWTGRPNDWTFDGNIERPTFNPSVKITGLRLEIVNRQWTGEYIRDDHGNPLNKCCHYFLHEGILKYCGDCTHDLVGQNIPLPDLPEEHHDPKE